MAFAPVLPRLARNVVEEHRTLRTLLAEVEGAFGRPSPHAARGPDVVAARLDALRGPLLAHFEEEERAGLFQEIEDCAPDQAPACSRLRAEHEGLIRRLDALRTSSPEARRRPTWIHDVRVFLRDLSGHEERETDLLTRTLDGSIGALD